MITTFMRIYQLYMNIEYTFLYRKYIYIIKVMKHIIVRLGAFVYLLCNSTYIKL